MNDEFKYLLQELTIAVIDDHALVLEGFKSLLANQHIYNVETFRHSKELLGALGSRLFDIYIIDIGLPDIDGFELIDAIRTRHPEARIIVNTIHEEVWLVKRMISKDVNAILYKTTDFTQVMDAMVAVMNGERYYCPELKKTASRYKPGMEHPSVREIDVLKYLAKGYTSKEIAERLFISENTVEAHRKSLFSKLSARNIADLIVKAIARGYINPNGL